MELEEIMKFLDEYFPEKMAEISYSLELVKEVIDDTEDEVNEKVAKLTKDKKYDKVRDFLDKLEGIEAYQAEINKLLDRIKKLGDNSEVDKELPNYEEYRVDNKIVHTLDEDFVNKRPYAFALEGDGKRVTTWTAMLRETCQLLTEKGQDTFINFITDPEMQGKKRSYFAYDGEEMNSPLKIKVGTEEVYVESHLSANGIRDLIKKILDRYEIKIDNYNVYFRADYSELHEE